MTSFQVAEGLARLHDPSLFSTTKSAQPLTLGQQMTHLPTARGACAHVLLYGRGLGVRERIRATRGVEVSGMLIFPR